MDGHLILEFDTENEASACLAAINNLAATWWAEQGYTVIDNNGNKEVIGRVNGVDAPDKARTTTWDIVKLSPDDTYYISSPSNKSEYEVWEDKLHEAGFMGTGDEKPYPEDWEED